MAYLDSREYYQRRQKFVEFCLLQRDYFTGHPYLADPLGLEATGTTNTLWLDYLVPNDKKPPAFVDNIPRTKIELIGGRVWPVGSRVVFEGLQEELLTAVLGRLLYFADDYAPGLKGLDEWIEAVVTDTPQTGDGGVLVQFVEGERRTRFMYHASESWDVEMDTLGCEPGFYRIEFRMKEADGQEVFRRWDIYRDSIQRFSSRPPLTFSDDGVPPPARIPVAADPSVPLMPPQMHPIDNADDAAERAVMAQLSDWIFVPLRWRRLAAGEQRGAPELMLNDLACTDDMNRLLQSWKVAAHNIGAPALFIRDCDIAEAPGGEKKRLSNEDVGPGSIQEITSNDPDHEGDVFYPNHAPTSFPHSDVLERFHVALAGNTPLTEKNIDRFGELSAFARDVLEAALLQRVGRIRDRIFDNGIGRVLKTGIELLALKEAVPGLTLELARQVKVRFEYGGAKLSADEELKQITGCSMLQKLGLPAAEIVAKLPFAPQDVDACVKALEEREQEADMLLELQQAMPKPQAKPQTKPPEAAGVDKRGQ